MRKVEERFSVKLGGNTDINTPNLVGEQRIKKSWPDL